MTEETPTVKISTTNKGLSSLPPMHKMHKTTHLRNHPKNGITNAAYAAKHGISKRQASKQRRTEKHG